MAPWHTIKLVDNLIVNGKIANTLFCQQPCAIVNKTELRSVRVITRAHSFLRAAEFRVEPRNLAVAVEFPCFRGIPRKHGNSAAMAKFRKSVLLL